MSVTGCIRMCANPKCEEVERDGAKFQRCGKCKRKVYCGRECQVGHWKTHKKTCRKSGDESIVNYVEDFLTISGEKFSKKQAKILLNCFQKFRGVCVSHPTKKDLTYSHTSLAQHMYTFFGRTDHNCDDDQKNSPEFARNVHVIPKFLEWFETGGPKKLDLSVAKEIATRGATETIDVLKFHDQLPGIVNHIKQEVFLGDVELTAYAAALKISGRDKDVDAMMPGQDMSSFNMLMGLITNESRWIGADMMSMAMVDGMSEDETKKFMEPSMGLMMELNDLYDMWREVLLKRQAEQCVKPTGRKFTARPRISEINLDEKYWRGRQYDNPDAVELKVEFETRLLKQFTVGQTVTGDYTELSDGTWIFSKPGYVWPSFYNVDRLCIWLNND